MATNVSESALPPRQLACQACRKRKIRCDKLSPCSHCKSSGIPCQSSERYQGARQRAQRSSRADQTIADLNKKIEQLSQHLQPAASSPASSPSVSIKTPNTSSTSLHDQSSSFRGLPQRRESAPSFEGDSSFNTHSKQATQAFEASLASTPHIQADKALSGAIQNLQSVLNPPKPGSPTQVRPDDTQESDYKELAALPMPPSELVLRMLRYFKGEYL